jgi:hypothetical protein
VKTIKEIVADPVISPYRGSEKTYEMVKEQIRERWGDKCADEFDAHTDAMPFSFWAAYNYRVKKGEHALKSVTFIEVKDGLGNVVRKVRRTVNLFHKRQVEPVKAM